PNSPSSRLAPWQSRQLRLYSRSPRATCSAVNCTVSSASGWATATEVPMPRLINTNSVAQTERFLKIIQILQNLSTKFLIENDTNSINPDPKAHFRQGNRLK